MAELIIGGGGGIVFQPKYANAGNIVTSNIIVALDTFTQIPILAINSSDGFVLTSGNLVADTSGLYQIVASVTAETPSSNDRLEMRIRNITTGDVSFSSVSKQKNANDWAVLVTSGVLYMNINDELSVEIKDIDSASTIPVMTVSVTIHQIL